MTTKPHGSAAGLGRIGLALVLGAAAGYGVQRVLERARRDAPLSGPIDWDLALGLARRVADLGQTGTPVRTERTEQYRRFVGSTEPLVAEYLKVRLPAPVERILVVDRGEWLELNLGSFRALLAPVEAAYDRLRSRGDARGATNGRAIGLQIGLMLGLLARRVLGQYDLHLLSPDPAARGSLYFVEPNVSRIQRELGLEADDFRLWLTLHELTHVFEFEAFPWVRPYFQDLLGEFLAGVTGRLEHPGRGLLELLERLVLGRGHWIQRVLSPRERRAFDSLQALMTLSEGYSNHVMNTVGARVLPSFEQIEARIRQRQRDRSLAEDLFDRLTGIQLKRAQYRQGEAFVASVVTARGIEFMNRAWQGQDSLPTMAEIREPRAWVSRMERQPRLEG